MAYRLEFYYEYVLEDDTSGVSSSTSTDTTSTSNYRSYYTTTGTSTGRSVLKSKNIPLSTEEFDKLVYSQIIEIIDMLKGYNDEDINISVEGGPSMVYLNSLMNDIRSELGIMDVFFEFNELKESIERLKSKKKVSISKQLVRLHPSKGSKFVECLFIPNKKYLEFEDKYNYIQEKLLST